MKILVEDSFVFDCYFELSDKQLFEKNYITNNIFILFSPKFAKYNRFKLISFFFWSWPLLWRIIQK